MKRKNVMRFLATAITVCMMSTNVTWASSDVSTPPVETDQEQSDMLEETGENGQEQETEGNEESTVVPEEESEFEEETENSENGIALQNEESDRARRRRADRIKGKQLEISGWSVNRRRNFPVSFCLSQCLGKREWPLCE